MHVKTMRQNSSCDEAQIDHSYFYFEDRGTNSDPCKLGFLQLLIYHAQKKSTMFFPEQMTIITSKLKKKNKRYSCKFRSIPTIFDKIVLKKEKLIFTLWPHRIGIRNKKNVCPCKYEKNHVENARTNKF